MSLEIKTLEFQNVTLAFEAQTILREVSLRLPVGHNCRWVFSSEKEKFFIFHALSQLEGFASGQFLINDVDVLDMSFEEFLPYRLCMGFGFANRGLLQNRSLRDNLLLPLEFHKIGQDQDRKQWLDHLMGYFDLRQDLGKRPSEVAPSAQKATLLLRAFIHKPQWVILDTPEMLLQKGHQASLLQLVEDHRRHFGLRHLYFSTNDEDLADCLTETALVVRQKRVNLSEPKSKERGVA